VKKRNRIARLLARLFPLPLLALACGSPPVQDAPREAGAPVHDAGATDAAPALELTLGLCIERYVYVEGSCTATAPECAPLAESYTRRAIRETEHYAGFVQSAYSDECPERHDFQDFAEVFEPDGCTLVCAFRFDIIQGFQP
jgi:hypothetical protein